MTDNHPFGTGPWSVVGWLYRLVVLVCWTCAPCQLGFCQESSPLSIQDALAAREFPFGVPIQLSPDGKFVAYTLQTSKAKEPEGEAAGTITTRSGLRRRLVGCDVWVSNVETGEETDITQGYGSSWGPSWSPDGRKLAFYSDRKGTQTLWVWDRADGSLRQVSEAIVRVQQFNYYIGPQWMPDGKQVLTTILPTGVTLEEVSAVPNTSAVSSDIKKEKYPGSTVIVYERQAPTPKSQAAQRPLGWMSDLAIIDVASGRVNRIFHAETALTWYRLSPDGGRVALTTEEPRELGKITLPRCNLIVLDMARGQPRILARDLSIPCEAVSWSPDGQYLAYKTYSGGFSRPSKGECIVVSAMRSERYNLTSALPVSLLVDYSRAPLWSSTGQAVYVLAVDRLSQEDPASLRPDALWRLSVPSGEVKEVARVPGRMLLQVVSPSAGGRFWSPDGGRSLILVTRNPATMKVGFCKADLSSGKCEKLFEENKYYGDVDAAWKFDAPLGSNVMVYMAQDAQHPEDIWAMNGESWARKRVTRANPQFERLLVGASRLVEWNSLEGRVLRGALLLPTGYEQGKKYPLIVYLYPGDLRSSYLNVFGFETLPAGTENMQLFATRGYAVLFPDVPVKIGQGTHLQDIAKAVIPGVDKVIEMGIADPDRLGVMGLSSGGYGVLCLLVQTTRFKAAISRSGFSDLISQYLSMRSNGTAAGLPEIESYRTGATLWEKRERFVENSPVFFLDKIETPLLLIHGGEDPFVPPALAEETFVALRRLGKEVQYAKYLGEGHGEVDWSLANKVDYLSRIMSWFDSHLKRGPRINRRSRCSNR